ncbi:MAG: LuxR family transcriptional regulator [Rhodobacteraceae bacterium]|nr:LuxR family transcriptional regulator [Paracoccaceae bacterium]
MCGSSHKINSTFINSKWWYQFVSATIFTSQSKKPTLTVRELDIAPLLVANATRSEIARHLRISEETVKHHTRNILRKFEATNVRDAFEALSEH